MVQLGEEFLQLDFPEKSARAYILLTFDGRKEQIETCAGELENVARESGAISILKLTDKEVAGNVWKIRGVLVKAVEAVSEQEPLDIVVPINQIDTFVNFVNELESKVGMRMIPFGHAGDGNVHLCVVRGERDNEAWEKELKANLSVLYSKAHELGGLVSGEHGIGLSKQKYLLDTTPAVNIALMKNIKRAFDDRYILNPGMSYDG